MSVKTIRDFVSRKGDTPLVCLTAYTSYMAQLISPHVDMILVGDSLGMVQYGMRSTVPVCLEMMTYHGRAVTQGAPNSFVVVDMPFGSYQKSKEDAFEACATILKQTDCTAIKLEGGVEMAETIRYLTRRGVAVLGHIGLKPQSVHTHGGYRMMGKKDHEKQAIMDDALAVQQAGAFGMVLECVENDLASEITESVNVPTIGIGASASCDGQILVTEDLLGMTGGKVPSFVKQYKNLSEEIGDAVLQYSNDVKKRIEF